MAVTCKKAADCASQVHQVSNYTLHTGHIPAETTSGQIPLVTKGLLHLNIAACQNTATTALPVAPYLLKKPEQTPSCTRPVAVVSRTTAHVTWMLVGCC